MISGQDFDWTEARILMLRNLRNEGVPMAEIGRRLGCTKNAAVGKAGRLKLAPRPSPILRDRERKPYVPRTPKSLPLAVGLGLKTEAPVIKAALQLPMFPAPIDNRATALSPRFQSNLRPAEKPRPIARATGCQYPTGTRRGPTDSWKFECISPLELTLRGGEWVTGSYCADHAARCHVRVTRAAA